MNHSIVRSLLLAVGVMGLGLLTASAWDSSLAEVERYSTLSTNFVTPHTPWARPYAQGTLRGYYFVGAKAEGMLTHAREAVELMQRLDLTLDVSLFYRYYGDYWFGGDIGPRRIGLLLRKPHDVFIFQDVSPTNLNDRQAMKPPNENVMDQNLDAKANFLAQVQAGAGVVLIGTDDGKLFADATVLADLPPFLAGTGALKVLTVGKGRVVQMPARPQIAYRLGWEVTYDLWQEKLTRAVLWAAGRTPETSLQLDGPTMLDQSQAPGQVVNLTWQGATAGKTELALRLRRWDGVVTNLGTVLCEQAAGRRAFPVPRLTAGTYHQEAFARLNGRAQGWAVTSFVVTASVDVADIVLETPYPLPKRPAVRGDSKTQAVQDAWAPEGIYTPYVEVGDPIRGQVRLSAPPTKGLTLRISLVAPDGRELVRREQPAALDQAFSFTAEKWMPMLVRVEARLRDGENEAAFAYRYQRIVKRHQGQFNFLLWAAPTDETLGPYALEKLSEFGVTTILSSISPSLELSAYGMSYVPWSGGGGGVILQQVENWQDAERNQGFAKNWGMNARGTGVLSYSVGDEIPTRGMGKGPKTDAYFRDYLRKVYGTVEALNQEWDSTFAALDEITVQSGKPDRVAKDDLPPKAPFSVREDGLENHAVDYDVFYFAGYNFVQMAKQWRDGIVELCKDPHAKIGFEGSAHICRGMADPELVCRELDMWAPYTSISEEFIRSVAPRSFIRSSWIGYDQNADSHLGHYWRQIMMGADSVWYWMWSAIGAWQGFQQPDLTVPAPVQEMLRDTQVVRDGLGDLLLNYEMQHDGIAVLYSYPSIFVHDRSPRCKTYLSHWAAYLAWQNIVHDLNMQYNFVTETSLANGEFAAGGYKVLILPQVWALSDASVSAIRKFAASGGTVIADVRPAFYDERTRQRNSGALDDLFGVTGGFEPAAKAELKIAGELGLSKLELNRPGKGYGEPVQFDPSVTLAAGRALGSVGNVPACIVNAVGTGRAILLNFVPRSSFEVRDDPGSGGMSGKPTSQVMPEDEAFFFLDLFHAAGIERAFTFTESRNEKVPFFRNVGVQRWKNGDYQIVGFFRQVDTVLRRGSVIPDSEKYPVSPQRKAEGRPYAPFPWVYDLKNGLTVGNPDWFLTDIHPGRASFYAFLPGPLPPMAVELPKQAKRGKPVSVGISVPQARGLHAIKLRATLPDGQPAKFWNQTVLVGKEPKTVVLPLAWNDPAGTWTITCSDLFGPDTEQTVAVKVE